MALTRWGGAGIHSGFRHETLRKIFGIGSFAMRRSCFSCVLTENMNGRACDRIMKRFWADGPIVA